MNWPFDDGSDLPLRDGFDVGGAQERKMASMVGGYSGIRTVEELNPDGSITILRTRGGRPIFETTAVRRSSQAQKYRGFVAKIPTRAVLFDPYTLDILDANYQPAVNTYSVQDFATSWNVPTDDDTDWYDVVLFDGSTIKVNSKAMPALGITANHGYSAIPYVINRETAEDQYGNAELNTTEKRVFAVGRYSVTSWGGGGVTEILTPTAPRTEDRAMTIGQRVDHYTDTAWIGQLYHHASGWDYYGGEWGYSSAEILMKLTSMYLTKTASSSDVAISVAALPTPSLSGSGTEHRYIQLPVVAQVPVGVGEIVSTTYPQQIYIQWPYREVMYGQFDGDEYHTFSDSETSATVSTTVTQAGVTLDVLMSNSRTFSSRSKSITVASQDVTLPSDGTKNVFRETQQYNSIDGYYFSGVGHPISAGARGDNTAHINGDNIPIEGSFLLTEVDFVEEMQTCSFSVKISETDDNLVSFEMQLEKYSGEDFSVNPNGDVVQSYLDNPFVGLNIYNSLIIENDAGMTEATKIAGWANISSLANSWVGTKSYAEAGSIFDDANSSAFIYYYYGSKETGISRTSANVEWETKDYILYDKTNGVYVSVEGEFVGVDTAATLTVILKVQTRHHTVTQTLGEYSYTYTQLVQEREIGTTGKYAMPSPQIRAIFAPLFQEQGSFKGAHYVTAEEESNGATPAHLFNFVLYPEPYSAIGTLNATNDEGHAIHFVPCNLLEMLYAFVFSQEYGVAEDGTRYPVTFTARYNDMMSTLFSSAYRVSVRDGVQGNWSDSLGADFASISTVSLHRT